MRDYTMQQLSHLDGNGRARMIDVGAKTPTRRQAVVRGAITLSAEAFEAMQQQTLHKGDPYTVAKIAGMQAAKRTSEWIPLCHPLPIEHLDIRFEPDAPTRTIRVQAQARTTAKTGIELEAFVAVTAALLNLYDMVKAVDASATMTDIQLVRKTGGKQPFQRRA